MVVLLLLSLHFTAEDAVQAEWSRRVPPEIAARRDRLAPGDRMRLERAEQRIGAPGAPPLLPPLLDHPEVTAWEAQARVAHTAEERFTALHMLNRLGSVHALDALAGLRPADAIGWPRDLHLELQVAAARLRGAQVSPELAAFLAAVPGDPVRAQAARLRLVHGRLESTLLPLVQPTPGAILMMLDAWNRAPWPARATAHLQLLALVRSILRQDSPGEEASSRAFSHLGLRVPAQAVLERALDGLVVRLLEGLPDPAPAQALPTVFATLESSDEVLYRAGLGALRKFHDSETWSAAVAAAKRDLDSSDTRRLLVLLPTLRQLEPALADALGARMLVSADGLARAAAIDDLAKPPVDLSALVHRVANDAEVDSLQALVHAFERWSLSAEKRREVLRPFLSQQTWITRYEAWQVLHALDPTLLDWPSAPSPTPVEQAILREARRLVQRGKPVRLLLRFSQGRAVTLRLDPAVAPINVANLVLLARRGFFDGQIVPRIVPDYVVQLGSPLGTTDGGPGHSVRCEYSLTPYLPGSVGMALAGKDTGGSQFFITTNATPHLIGRYTHLGQVEDPERALPLLDALELGATLEHVEVLPEQAAPSERLNPGKARRHPGPRKPDRAAPPSTLRQKW